VPLVLRDDTDGVARLTLNRPEKLNALTPELFAELRGHLDAIAGDATIGAVVLGGAGRSFCAGNDLDAIRAGHRGPDGFEAATIDALEALPQPVIARVHGHCVTGGLELALGCDLIVAAESAKFQDTHGKWGLVPVWGMTVRLPERVGRARARDLMFTARRIDGATALAYGLADRCVPDDDLDQAVADLAAEITANSWGTSRIEKSLFAAQSALPRAEALAHERALPFGRPADAAERMTRR
jgi:enoyl-CoA hydratase/carnithine racemase